MLWGVAIDALQTTQFTWHGLSVNRFSLFFCGVAATFVAALALTRCLHEPEAAGMEELLRELLIESPQRLWVRLRPW